MTAEALPAASDGPGRDGAASPLSVVAGRTIGSGYVLESRMHAGASAEVWRARDTWDRTYAVKIASVERHRAAALARIKDEHSLLAALDHRSILRPYAIHASSVEAALVSEYLPGGDLVSLAGAPPPFWAPAARAVLDALAYLHARGFVHGDVKARNVLFDAAGRPRLIDFGSAAVIGTPRGRMGSTPAHRYARTGAVSATDDAYAFAVLAYELMTGALPFGIGGRSSAADRVRPPARPDAPARLARLVMRSLAARSEADVASIDALRDGLESAFSAADRE